MVEETGVRADPNPPRGRFPAHLGRDPLARLQRTLHVSAPYRGGLGAGPVDAAGRLAQGRAARGPAARAEVRGRPAAGPLLFGPGLFGVLERPRGARRRRGARSRRGPGRGAPPAGIAASSRASGPPTKPSRTPGRTVAGRAVEGERDRPGVGDRLAAEPVGAPERLLVQRHALGQARRGAAARRARAGPGGSGSSSIRAAIAGGAATIARSASTSTAVGHDADRRRRAARSGGPARRAGPDRRAIRRGRAATAARRRRDGPAGRRPRCRSACRSCPAEAT